MFYVQLAVTLAVIHIVSQRMLSAALNPIAILTGRTTTFPVWTLRIATFSFWLGIVFALIGIWSLQ